MRVIGDELTETRAAFQRELELLKKRGTELAELNFVLEGEIADRDARIRTLEARLAFLDPGLTHVLKETGERLIGPPSVL